MNNFKKCYGKYHGDELVPFNEFGKNKSRPDGLCTVCKQCVSKSERERRKDPVVLDRLKQHSKKYYLKNKQSYYDRKKKNTSTPRGYKVKMIAQARLRARDKNLEFDLSIEDIDIPAHCPVLGIPLLLGTTTKQNKDNAPSLDRIDSTRGYTPDNITIVSWRANKLKSNSTVEEMKLLYEYYEKFSEA